MVKWILFLITLATAQAQTVREEKVYTRDGWVLENGVIRVALLRGGGHIAEVRLISSDPKKSINPMRVPHYPTIDPHRYIPAQHDATYGDGPHRWLSAGYMGHLLCFPFYGPPSSEDEVKAQLGNHGEAPIVEWKKIRVEQLANGVRFWYGADLVKTQYRVERAVTLERGAHHVRVEEWVQNLAGFDRPFQWMQHATFGPPFVEPGKTTLDASVTRVWTTGGSLAANAESQWPAAKDADGKGTNLRVMQRREKSGTYVALLTDRSRTQEFFTLFHPEFRLLIGYVFPAAQNPWLADWQENRRNTIAPWNNQVVARGLEFGNSPVAEGLHKAVDRGTMFGVPAYGWIGAHQKLKNEFTIFLDEIQPGFSGVKDVLTGPDGPKVVSR